MYKTNEMHVYVKLTLKALGGGGGGGSPPPPPPCRFFCYKAGTVKYFPLKLCDFS